jgi:hypothetical protein
MSYLKFKRHSVLSQPIIFKISTDIENFKKVMPNYFKSLEIIEKKDNQIIVLEKIKFFGINLKIKTKHEILKPDIHKVHILSGPTKGSEFIETYVPSKNGSDIIIEIKLVFNGYMKIFRFLEGYIAKKMETVMNEFIFSAEKYHLLDFYSQ